MQRLHDAFGICLEINRRKKYEAELLTENEGSGQKKETTKELPMKEKDSVEEREREKAIRERKEREREKASVLRKWSFQKREEGAEKRSRRGH